jgi:hypothetical protein
MKVTIYSLPDCPKCDKLKEYLEKRRVEFETRWFDTEAQTDFIMMNMFGNPPILKAGSAVNPSEELFEGDTLKVNKIMEVLESG